MDYALRIHVGAGVSAGLGKKVPEYHLLEYHLLWYHLLLYQRK